MQMINAGAENGRIAFAQFFQTAELHEIYIQKLHIINAKSSAFHICYIA